jgi:toxin ParE1/3/4
VTRCAFTPLAERDLEEIGDYIATGNPRRAVSFVRELRQRCEAIVEMPLAAPLRPELGQALRVVVFHRYLICYSVDDDGQVVVERIAHGARRVVDLF